MLSLRIEQAYSKDKILELYLNEIYFGLGAYGVASAALTYFDKSVHELTLAETAYLAALPKGPNNYNPFRHPDRAVERRNWVIDRMVENGYATKEEGEAAKKEPLGVVVHDTTPAMFGADYFVEEVRRELIDMYGEKTLYEGGLSVRTSLNPQIQVLARQSLVDGLVNYDEEPRLARPGRPYRRPVARLGAAGRQDAGARRRHRMAARRRALGRRQGSQDRPAAEPRAGHRQGRSRPRDRHHPVRPAEMGQVADRPEDAARRSRAPATCSSVGDVIYVEKADGGPDEYTLRQVPEVEGSIVVMDPHTGRVLAMVGGFSYDLSEFNRATQAERQPGSSFKPFVYSAALDNGYTPSSVVMDAPLSIDLGNGQGVWEPENYEGDFLGPSTLRTGIVHSRNVMTVRLAQDMGMPLIAEYARRFGIYDNMLPVLSMALGAGETTVLRMAAGYSVFDNGGKEVRPTLIDRIQNRYGQTIFRHENRTCEGCDAESWHNQPEPQIVDNAEQVLDPMTAYQITSMMEDVIKRGTGTAVKVVGKPIAGKTGTTSDYHDAWFAGFSPDLVAVVYVGFDKPRSLGRGETGGALAAPIFAEFMKMALADKPPIPFRVPPGITFIPINQQTGLRANPGDPGTILEAFKPGTGPPDTYSIIGYTDTEGRPLTVAPESDRAVISGTGGLY